MDRRDTIRAGVALALGVSSGPAFAIDSKQPGGTPYKTYLVSADGTRKLIVGRAIVIELGPDQELELDLAPHANFRGGLPLVTGSARTTGAPEKQGFCSNLVVHPGASNVLHVSVERSRCELVDSIKK